MRQKNQLGLEQLESRDTPAAFGIAWSDAANITVSFVQDGLYSDGSSSNLFAQMRTNRLSNSVWQGEMLRAVQTWASQANLNVGLVADTGGSAGTAGASQGDSRFGDIRISMRAFDGGFLAITTPPGNNNDTLSGDIVLNSNFKFSVGGAGNTYDLYTTMLQEVGHALGLGNSSNTSSPMYEWYQGVRTGLDSSDVSNIQSLYGSRAADSFETGGNETIATAKAVPTASGTSTLYAQADIANSGDTDVFSFAVPPGQSGSVAIKLRTAGRSLLAANVTILDATGSVVATGNAGAGGDITLNQALLAGQTYYVQVKSATGTAYAAGAYKLSVVFDPAASDPATAGAAAPTYAADGGSDDTLATATALSAVSGTTALARYQADAVIENSSDIDHYAVQAPPQASTLIATVRATDAGSSPVLSFYDASGNALAATEVSSNGTTRVYQILNVAADSVVTIRVAGAPADYRLTTDFVQASIDMAVVETGTLDSSSTSAYGSVTLNQSQYLAFNLQSNATVRVSIYNSVTHAFVTSITVTGGQTAASTVFLNAGEYSLKYTYLSGDYADYSLRLQTLSDPIGVPLLNPGGGGGGVPYTLPSYDYFYHDPTWYEWMQPLA